MEADERSICGQLVRLEGVHLRAVADHKGDTVLTQELHDVVVEPALMAKLEAVAARRELRERRRQSLVVAPERRRELPKHRPKLGRGNKWFDPSVEELQAGGRSRNRFTCVT